MNQMLETAIASAVQELFATDVRVELTRPDEQFGDFATNVALQLAKPLEKSPREIAEQLAVKLRETLADSVAEITVAGPGFINLTLQDSALVQGPGTVTRQTWANKVVVAEYSDPNPFKILHAGHLYTSLVGDAIANLLEHAGATVHRVNFGGDVGLHVAKTMWAIMQELGGEHPEQLHAIPDADKLNWVSERYVAGNNAYDDDEAAKAAMTILNKRVYDIFANNDHDTPFAQIYWTCRQWSYDGFNSLYDRLGMHPFEKYYPESEVADLGLATVKAHIGPVYQESEGAIVFHGEPYGLFTQVFINSEGLPTYAAKDVGLAQHKYQDYHYDTSFIITDASQKDHLAVVFKSIEQYEPDLAAKTMHRTHGRIKLAGGVKMSSRKGNILAANDILDATREATLVANDSADDAVVLGAVRYSFLKNRIGGDIVYEPAESVSLEGNSGPYLQYAHTRARSILRRAAEASPISGDRQRSNAQTPAGRSASVLADHPELHDATTALNSTSLQPGERSLVRKLTEYSEVIDRAVDELMPHHICTYLYELAQTFNRFYEHNRVIGDERQQLRLQLVQRYADTLKAGFDLLHIPAPEKM